MLRQKHILHGRPNFREVAGALAGVVIFVFVMFLMAACVSTSHNAKAINDLTISKTCSVLLPVTDTTSPQVRANNRARYSLCATLEKTK